MSYALVIVKPPNYIHWQSFREIGRAICWAASSLGHDIVECDISEAGDRRAIVLGEHTIPTARPNDIIYNWEWYRSPLIHERYRQSMLAHETWDYSATNKLNVDATHVGIGYVPILECINQNDNECDIDVLHFGSMNERRASILNEINWLQQTRYPNQSKLKVLDMGFYYEARDKFAARSKVVLNCHYYAADQCLEWPRVSYMINNRICVVSEKAPDASIPGAVPYDRLAERALLIARSPSLRRQLIDEQYEWFRKIDYAENLRRVIEGVVT